MFYLLYMVCVTTLQLWTIHFVNDDKNDKPIITDDLAKFNIDVLGDISEESRAAYGFGHSNVDTSSPSNFGLKTESHNLEKKNDDSLENTAQIHEIRLRITKVLFLKMVELTLPNNVKFTANEMYDILENIFIFLTDKTCVLYTIYKNMLDNPDIFDELVNIYKSKGKEDYLFRVVLPSFAIELENHMILMKTDDSAQ